MFFFMNKTAYELRISDCGSDVCSSDLIYDNAASQNLAISASMTLCRRDELDATVAMLGVVPGDEALHPSTGLVDVCEAFARIGRREIGRASCRERVCQYV